MIELLHLVNAVILLAVVLRPFIEWVKYIELLRELDRQWELEERERMLNTRFRYSTEFALSRPNANAISSRVAFRGCVTT